jgi:hypothetical protein
MPTENETDKPVAKTKEEIEAKFKRRFKYGLKITEGLKARKTDEDTTTDESGK